MRKRTNFISVMVVILIPLTLFFLMSMPVSQNSREALNGELDLRGEDLENRVFALNGDWRFTFSESGIQELINVPSLWANRDYPRLGEAEYGLKLQVTDTLETYMLLLNTVSGSYSVYCNGNLLYERGNAGSATDNNALVAVNPENGVIDLVIRVSNSELSSGGLSRSIFFGTVNSVQRYFFRTRLMYAAGLGCILMTAFYHLLLYFFRRKELSYLFFFFLCFSCFTRFIFETDGLNAYFGLVSSGKTSIRVNMALFAFHSCSILIFAFYVFARDFIVKHKKKAALCFIMLVLAYWFMPLNKDYSQIVSTLLLFAPMLFTIIKSAVSPVLRQNRWTVLYFISLIVYLCIGLTKAQTAVYMYMPGLVSNLFMILSQCLLLSQSYTKAFALAEETNKNLEGLVDERTKDLKAANTAISATNTAMKELITNISHDLKTPLSVLSLNLEALSGMAETKGDLGYQRHARTAYQKNLDLQRLLQNLFEVNRIETGRNIYSPEYVPVYELLSQIRERYDVFLDDRGIGLEVTEDHGQKGLEIYTDPQKIWSVFDNIIYNAARYTDSGGSVEVSTCLGNKEDGILSAFIIVSDTGVGIASEHLPFVFERFYKASQERKGREGESGLGLYIVKSIMEGCGGEAEARSEAGKGTSIILKFAMKRTAIQSLNVR